MHGNGMNGNALAVHWDALRKSKRSQRMVAFLEQFIFDEEADVRFTKAKAEAEVDALRKQLAAAEERLAHAVENERAAASVRKEVGGEA